MIRAICLNPIVDRMYYIDDFEVSEKYFAKDPDVCPGGKGVNVARVLALLGGACEVYGFVGGHNGRLVEDELASYGLPFHRFAVDGETRTAINVIDHSSGAETEIVESGVELGPERQREFLDALAADLSPHDMVVCSGLPMPGMTQDVYRRVSELCAGKGCDCVLDATGRYLKASLPGRYHFAKPNAKELWELFGLGEPPSQDDTLACARRMQAQGIENVLVSLGGSGGIFLGAEGAFRATVPQVRVMSTIGSGDAAVAGFCHGSQLGLGADECVRLAMACGASNAQYSKTGFVDAGEVQEIARQVTIQSL